MPRVVHVITGLGVGGAERSLHSLLAGLDPKRGEHVVISLTDKGSFGPRIEALGLRVHALGMSAGRLSFAGLRRFRKILRAERPDILQGWMYHGNLVALLGLGLAPGRPVLAWNIRQSLYDIGSEKRSTRAVIQLGRLMSPAAGAILYNSELARRHHEDFGFARTRAEVIPNGFDLSLWKPDAGARGAMRAEMGIPPDAPVVGYVGRYHWMKDPATFLGAIRPLLSARPDLHCVMIGRNNGPDNPELADGFRGLPMERLHLPGERRDIPQCMAAFDALCLSSATEAFPNVLGEAMACGVPCVSTDVGDARHVVGDAGWIVPPGDSQAMAKAMDALLSLPATEYDALATRARQRIEDTFSLAATVERYQALYDRLC